jgi:hypothetical protein
MSATFCSFCGKPIPPGATFCPACGASVARGYAPPAAPPSGAPYATFPGSPYSPQPAPMAGGWGAPPPMYPGGPTQPSPQSRQRDITALRAIQIAAIIALIGFGLSAATLVLTPISQVASTSTSGSGQNTTIHFNVNQTLLYALLVSGGVLALL